MTTTQTTKVTYRKTQAGAWVAFGPASIVRQGAEVVVTKANGDTKTERIASVGKSFAANGVQCCYGYLAERPARPATIVSSNLRAANDHRYAKSASRSNGGWECDNGHTHHVASCECCRYQIGM